MSQLLLGKNVLGEIKGNKLTLEIDLSKDLGPSKSEKNIIIATTSGNKALPNGTTIGLNVYREKSASANASK